MNKLKYDLLKAGIQEQATDVLANTKFTVARSAVPVVLASSGTVSTAGAITLTTALPMIYSSAWVRLPAGAVVGGSAGLYYVVFTSTTVGTVYTNYVNPTTEFVPSVPTGTLVVAVGSDSAYTPVLSTEFPLATFTVPAASMGANGKFSLNVLGSTESSSDVKTLVGKFGTNAFLTVSATTSAAIDATKSVVNRGSESVQLIHNTVTTGAVSTTSPAKLAVNTAADVTVSIFGSIAAATCFVVLESFEGTVLSS